MIDKKIDVLMSEMTAIRNEINTTKETIHSILNFFFILISAEISLFISALNGMIDFENEFVRNMILSIPFLFMCLSLYHSECVMRIHIYINYIDTDIRNKVSELLGEPLLNSHSKTATKSIVDVFRKHPISAKFGYLSKLGLKIMSIFITLLFYLYMVYSKHLTISVLELIMLIIDVSYIIILFFMQHD